MHINFVHAITVFIVVFTMDIQLGLILHRFGNAFACVYSNNYYIT